MNIQVFGQEELVQHLKDGRKVQSHLISIGNPKSFLKRRIDSYIPPIFHQSFTSILRISFYDVLTKDQISTIKFNKRIPKKKDVEKVISFFQKTCKSADGYTIHCWQGVSRSCAMALGLLYIIHNDEKVAAEELQRIRPIARPHHKLVKWFDEILGSDLDEENKRIHRIWAEKTRDDLSSFLESQEEEVEELEPLEEMEEL